MIFYRKITFLILSVLLFQELVFADVTHLDLQSFTGVHTDYAGTVYDFSMRGEELVFKYSEANGFGYEMRINKKGEAELQLNDDLAWQKKYTLGMSYKAVSLDGDGAVKMYLAKTKLKGVATCLPGETVKYQTTFAIEFETRTVEFNSPSCVRFHGTHYPLLSIMLHQDDDFYTLDYVETGAMPFDEDLGFDSSLFDLFHTQIFGIE